ncbi:MAG TPA: type IV secretion system DNA-binding domain-containing protein [Bryobacteraceae bacterium]|jgi:DNA helicase HerA-like ATPase|nr:type IV secretion system DNA-binding domain-containing protein [Bryobacteraceae bacterium]
MSLEPVPIGIQHDPGALYEQGELVINSEARRKHMAIFGTTGAGKSTLMRNMIAFDIASGVGCTVIDPHGQLVEDILNNHIPRSRIDDVIYFNPKDPDRTIPLNLLDSPDHELDGVAVDNVISIFKQLWPDAFAIGARMEDIFRNSFYALIENPSPTSLWNLPPFLTNDAYRAVILRKVKNPAVRDFFENTFNKWTNSFREEAVSPVLNKCRPFLTDPRIRAVIGPAHSTFRFRSLMDERKIFLCDLSKGAIGQDNARLLGSLIAMQEKLAALSRYGVPEEDRVSHMLYVEEAQNFIGDFESILSETRKFNLHLVLATQAIDQLAKPAASAVFGNCASLISFRVSSTDAQRLHDEFAMLSYIPETLQDLPDYEAYVRTLVANSDGVGQPTGPHLVSTYPPFPKTARNADREHVIETSTRSWTRSRAELEANLVRFLKREFKGKGK